MDGSTVHFPARAPQKMDGSTVHFPAQELTKSASNLPNCQIPQIFREGEGGGEQSFLGFLLGERQVPRGFSIELSLTLFSLGSPLFVTPSRKCLPREPSCAHSEPECGLDLDHAHQKVFSLGIGSHAPSRLRCRIRVAWRASRESPWPRLRKLHSSRFHR